jgi:hypothetical protein
MFQGLARVRFEELAFYGRGAAHSGPRVTRPEHGLRGALQIRGACFLIFEEVPGAEGAPHRVRDRDVPYAAVL